MCGRDRACRSRRGRPGPAGMLPAATHCRELSLLPSIQVMTDDLACPLRRGPHRPTRTFLPRRFFCFLAPRRRRAMTRRWANAFTRRPHIPASCVAAYSAQHPTAPAATPLFCRAEVPTPCLGPTRSAPGDPVVDIADPTGMTPEAAAGNRTSRRGFAPLDTTNHERLRRNRYYSASAVIGTCS